jgi:hypothetical protein
MNKVFMEYLDKFIVVFIDDILIFSKTEDTSETSVGKAQGRLTICQVQQMQILVNRSCFSWACHICWRSFSGSRQSEGRIGLDATDECLRDLKFPWISRQVTIDNS